MLMWDVHFLLLSSDLFFFNSLLEKQKSQIYVGMERLELRGYTAAHH